MFSFMKSAWGPCSATCGVSVRSRRVQCRAFVEKTMSVQNLPDSSCAGSRTVILISQTRSSKASPLVIGWRVRERKSRRPPPTSLDGAYTVTHHCSPIGPYLTLPPGWAGSYTCPVLRPYQLGPMRVPECNHKVTGNGYKAVNGCEAVNRRL